MSTPLRNVNNWSLTQDKNGGSSSTVQNPKNSDSKGKRSNFSEGLTPPPVNFLGANDGGVDGDGDMKVWKRFKKAGLLDEVSLEQKDRAALLDRVSSLEKELFEYQYNMGLLLIEKKEWISQYDEIREALAAAQDCLKRDQSSHLISISEVERREENLRNALGVKKQCVDDLEKALREVRAESAETKYNADLKMTEAHDLLASLNEKSFQVEAKLYAADAKLAEADRKSSEIDRKLKEVEAREIKLRSERKSLSAEREMNEAVIFKQREEMGEWERTLQEREDRLVDGRRNLNQREERANEMDKSLKQKQKDVDEIQKLVEGESSRLKQKEKDLDNRLAELVCKEKEADTSKEQLDIKEKELVVLEDKLNVQSKLLDEQNLHLESRRQDFELEMNKLNEKEKSFRSQEKDFEKEKKQLVVDKEEMQNLIGVVENTMAEIKVEKLRLFEEENKLKVTEEERTEHLRLTSELEHEIAKCKHEEELLLKEREGLKGDKENFERQWELLDEKKAEVLKDLKEVREERERLEKLKQS